ncbi:hypothetical protein IG631_04885 [Alternaria alternata]|nr:hypothetical protein IG631_04885 [Alternaria alternata]
MIIVVQKADMTRTSIHLELRHVSLSAAEAKSNSRTLIDNSLSSNNWLEKIADNQRLQGGELTSLRNSQEQLLRLLEEGRQPEYRFAMAVSQSTTKDGETQADPYNASKRPNFDNVIITTAYRSNSTCVSACFCVCHAQRTFETPSFLQQAIGRLFVGYVGIPLLKKPCDTAGCKRQGSPSWYSQYQFPRWYMQQRLLPLFAVITSFQPPRFTLEVPRVIDPESPVFQYALSGDLASLRRLFAERLASPTDINAHTGRTPLHVSAKKCLNRAEILY